MPTAITQDKLDQEYIKLVKKANLLDKVQNKLETLEKQNKKLLEENRELKKRVKTKIGYKVVERKPEYIGKPLQMLLEEQKNSGSGMPAKLAPDEVTLDRIADFARLQCTEAEMAGGLLVSIDTWHQFKNNYPEVQKTIDANRGQGKISLRRTQYRLAETSATMAIHLGKVELNQQDKTQVDVNVNVLQKLMNLPEPDDNYIDVEFEKIKEEIGIIEDDSRK
jgi:hypothetical protein